MPASSSTSPTNGGDAAERTGTCGRGAQLVNMPTELLTEIFRLALEDTTTDTTTRMIIRQLELDRSCSQQMQDLFHAFYHSKHLLDATISAYEELYIPMIYAIPRETTWCLEMPFDGCNNKIRLSITRIYVQLSSVGSGSAICNLLSQNLDFILKTFPRLREIRVEIGVRPMGQTLQTSRTLKYTIQDGLLCPHWQAT